MTEKEITKGFYYLLLLDKNFQFQFVSFIISEVSYF